MTVCVCVCVCVGGGGGICSDSRRIVLHDTCFNKV